MTSAVYPFVVREVRRRANDKAVLDVGCGAMQYRPFFQHYTGVDILNGRWSAGVEPTLAGRVEDVLLPHDFFTVVFGVASWGYMDDLSASLRACRTTLAPGGSLLIFDYQAPTGARIHKVDREHRNILTYDFLWRRLMSVGFAGDHIWDRSTCVWPAWHPKRLAHHLGFRGTWIAVEARK